jgi:nucleotide-binding universal stress UspA family protein
VNLLEEKISTAVSIKNILFSTDFSEASEAALPYAAAMSLRYGGMVHVAHVLPAVNRIRPSAIDPAIIGAIYEDAYSDTQEKMQRLSTRLRGFAHHTYIRHGKVSEVLSEMIREHDVDLLIAGTHGRTGVGKLLLGSVAEEIFRTVTCPVLTVGPKVPRAFRASQHGRDEDIKPTSVEFRQILYATDFTPQSLAAGSYAFSLAREFRSQLILLHVIEKYHEHLQDRPGPIDLAFRRLEELKHEDAALRYRPEPTVKLGSPVERILQTAAERNADLIVLGAQRHSGGAVHLLWTTAHQVVAQANCPVLTVLGQHLGFSRPTV